MQPARSLRLRIFSANLLKGRARVQDLAALLRDLAPDVVALQEFAPRHQQTLRELLPHSEGPLATNANMALGLRHPAKIEPVGGAMHRVFRARLEPEAWPGLAAPLEVLAGHITAPHLLPPWRTFAARRSQVRALVHHVSREPHVSRVLVGDLNATPRWPAYRRLASVFEDAATLVAGRSGRRPEPTWGPRPAGGRWLRIDHALVRGVTVEALRVVRVPGSDHCGLVVDLRSIQSTG